MKGKELGDIWGPKSYDRGSGIHAQTSDERRKNSIRGGQAAGRKSYEERKGPYARNSVDWRKDSGRGGTIAAIKRGQIPWSEDEIALAYELGLEYHYSTVAQALNNCFHKGREIRTAAKIKHRIYHYRLSLERKIKDINFSQPHKT